MTKIVSLEKLIKELMTRLPLSAVLVTGCFDVLHTEHKKLLLAAKEQGGVLVVGLESDRRVKKLKGSQRPVNPLDKRLENLSQWDVADYAFSLPEKFNSEADYFSLINQIKPRILAVSSSTPNLEEKQRLMKKIGGQLKVVLTYNPKVSTTRIIRAQASSDRERF